MSGSLIIVLIIVVWLFVLAPLLLRGQKPIRKAGEAFEETRVLYEGGSGTLPAPRRPRSSPTSVQISAEVDDSEASTDYEIVGADDEVLLEDNGSPRASRSAFIGMFTRKEKPAEESVEEIVDGEVVQEIEAADSAVATMAVPAEEEVENSEDEFFFDEETTYSYDDSYTSPADLMYPDDMAETETTELTDIPANGESSDTDIDTEEAVDEELTEEEIEFAQRRRGRGGYDPVADAQYTLTRYQRRQRTLIGLVAAVVITAIIGFVVGGWAWSLPVLAGLATGVYLFALRSQVREEESLRNRRMRQLRRATLGVRSAVDADLDIPRNLRRPGALVVEIDDESPDFNYLPVIESRFAQEDEQGRHEGRLQRRRSGHSGNGEQTFGGGRRAS